MPHDASLDNKNSQERFLDFAEQCNIELGQMALIVEEVISLLVDMTNDAQNQSVRNRAAAANLS